MKPIITMCQNGGHGLASIGPVANTYSAKTNLDRHLLHRGPTVTTDN